MIKFGVSHVESQASFTKQWAKLYERKHFFFFFGKETFLKEIRSATAGASAGSVGRATFGPGVISLNPTLGVEDYLNQL